MSRGFAPSIEGGKKSELSVITKAKDLCSYIMTVNLKSPKHFRYSFVSRMQNLALDIIENLYRANDTFVKKGDNILIAQRLNKQREVRTDLRILEYFAMLGWLWNRNVFWQNSIKLFQK